MNYREADLDDIDSVAKLLSHAETEAYWLSRVQGYLNKQHHPQKALLPRVLYVAVEGNVVVGLIAGHLTERFSCQGELQWINVRPEYRGTGAARELLKRLAQWFVQQNAFYICVDVGSEAGRNFYRKHGAEMLNEHWMVWKNIELVLQD